MEGMQNDSEAINRNVLIETLKSKGFEDPESKELMIAWCEKREAEVVADGSREAQVSFEIERAELYRDAGNAGYALSAFKDALMIAVNEGLNELALNIEEKMASLQ